MDNSDSETIQDIILNYNSEETQYDINYYKKMPTYRKKGIKALIDFLPHEQTFELELNIFDFSEKYIKVNDLTLEYLKPVYKSKIYDLHFNLNQKHSKTLLTDILNKKILIKTLPYLQFKILNPEIWDSIIKKKEFIEYKKENMTTSDAYECKRCKQSKCKVYLLQTRAADEPMTVFIQCEHCNCTFKIY